MARPSLETITKLAQRAPRDPRSRAVLHDALLARYGRQYEASVERAIEYAHTSNEPFHVRLNVSNLVKADAQAESQYKELGRRFPYVLENMYALTVDGSRASPRGLVTTFSTRPSELNRDRARSRSTRASTRTSTREQTRTRTSQRHRSAPKRMRDNADYATYNRLSRASKDYLNEYVSGTSFNDLRAMWRRVPEHERRTVNHLLEGERPGYERVESEIAAEWADD